MDTAEGETRGLELGGIDYLAKPINFDLLKLRVRNHIKLKENSDLLREQRDLLVRQKEELESALARTKRLEGIVPICMYCNDIRSDKDYWQKITDYITEHTDALFSHGICPKCEKKVFDEMANWRNSK
jgi:response regulator RpfG family c-di-GMP phosphodiesterase